jgi:hypothetical protein
LDAVVPNHRPHAAEERVVLEWAIGHTDSRQRFCQRSLAEIAIAVVGQSVVLVIVHVFNAEARRDGDLIGHKKSILEKQGIGVRRPKIVLP